MKAFLSLTAVLFAIALPSLLAAKPEINGKVAIEGYDAVAYFQDGKPTKGDRKITHQWKGSEWRFATESNRNAFAENPEKFAPQYGGYCAWAVSEGYTAKIDPKAWRIVDGKLYLNYNAKVQKQWEEDIPGHIKKADANWPSVLD